MKEELKVESEQKALDVLDAIRESKGITQAELGRRAFPDDAAPHMRIRALRVERSSGFVLATSALFALLSTKTRSGCL